MQQFVYSLVDSSYSIVNNSISFIANIKNNIQDIKQLAVESRKESYKLLDEVEENIKTIAKFKDANLKLSNKNADYEATQTLSEVESAQREHISKTIIAELKNDRTTLLANKQQSKIYSYELENNLVTCANNLGTCKQINAETNTTASTSEHLVVWTFGILLCILLLCIICRPKLFTSARRRCIRWINAVDDSDDDTDNDDEDNQRRALFSYLREKQDNALNTDTAIFLLEKGLHVVITMKDLTKTNVDVIVNAANERMLGGAGVDAAVHRAAGPLLLQKCRAVRPNFNGTRCTVGNAVLTEGPFMNGISNVIHTVGPDMRTCNDSRWAHNRLKDCYYNSLICADASEYKSIAFPAISCGIYRFPYQDAAAIAIRQVVEFDASQNTALSHVVFAFTDETLYRAWIRAAMDMKLNQLDSENDDRDEDEEIQDKPEEIFEIPVEDEIPDNDFNGDGGYQDGQIEIPDDNFNDDWGDQDEQNSEDQEAKERKKEANRKAYAKHWKKNHKTIKKKRQAAYAAKKAAEKAAEKAAKKAAKKGKKGDENEAVDEDEDKDEDEDADGKKKSRQRHTEEIDYEGNDY